jgi:diacylglycerol kinase family enzyme
LARNLHIPLSWRRALETLMYGEDVYMDIGKINERYFFNVAGVGLDGLISKKFNLESKSRGIMPYIYYGVKGYFEMPTFRVKITMNDAEFYEEIMIVAFANFKQYGGKAIIAPFATPYDSQLDLCIINKFKLVNVPTSLQKLFSGNIHKLPFYRTYKFEKVTIEALDKEIPSTIDGEYGGKDLYTYTVEALPAKIKIRIPPKTKQSPTGH